MSLSKNIEEKTKSGMGIVGCFTAIIVLIGGALFLWIMVFSVYINIFSDYRKDFRYLGIGAQAPWSIWYASKETYYWLTRSSEKLDIENDIFILTERDPAVRELSVAGRKDFARCLADIKMKYNSLTDTELKEISRPCFSELR